MLVFCLPIFSNPVFAKSGGESGGGGDVFVKEYNQVRKYWINRFTWIVKHRGLFSASLKGGCDLHTDYIFCDRASEVLSLLEMDQDAFDITTSPAYIEVTVDGKRRSYPAYSEKIDSKHFSTKFNFQYWQALTKADQRKELVLHEHLVVLGVEKTNEMDTTDEVLEELPEFIDSFMSTSSNGAEAENLGGGSQRDFQREYLENDWIKNALVRVWCAPKPLKYPESRPCHREEIQCQQHQQMQQQTQQQQQAISYESISLKPGQSTSINGQKIHCED